MCMHFFQFWAKILKTWFRPKMIQISATSRSFSRGTFSVDRGLSIQYYTPFPSSKSAPADLQRKTNSPWPPKYALARQDQLRWGLLYMSRPLLGLHVQHQLGLRVGVDLRTDGDSTRHFRSISLISGSIKSLTTQQLPHTPLHQRSFSFFLVKSVSV